jgi:hypothetical protein
MQSSFSGINNDLFVRGRIMKYGRRNRVCSYNDGSRGNSRRYVRTGIKSEGKWSEAGDPGQPQ